MKYLHAVLRDREISLIPTRKVLPRALLMVLQVAGGVLENLQGLTSYPMIELKEDQRAFCRFCRGGM